jgi:hypothetical protein
LSPVLLVLPLNILFPVQVSGLQFEAVRRKDRTRLG